MPPVLTPGQAAQEVLCCLGLGLAVGLARLALPLDDRGRGHRRSRRCAALADFLAVGLACLLVQAYAAGKSNAGGVRWYMLAGAACGAGAVLQLFGSAARRVQALAAQTWARFGALARKSGQSLARFMPRRRAQTAPNASNAEKRGRLHVLQHKKEQKVLAKNNKKILQTKGKMLYNSDV
jgi:hypothetical protein